MILKSRKKNSRVYPWYNCNCLSFPWCKQWWHFLLWSQVFSLLKLCLRSTMVYKLKSCAEKYWQNPAALNLAPAGMGGIHCAFMLGSRGSAAEFSHFQFPQGFTEVHHLIKSSCDLKIQQDFHPKEATCIASPLLARARFTTPQAVIPFSSFFFCHIVCVVLFTVEYQRYLVYQFIMSFYKPNRMSDDRLLNIICL